jgi:anti-sigma factor ChrR (cupin superfamily)
VTTRQRKKPPGERLVLREVFGHFLPEEHGEFMSFHPGVEILPLYGSAHEDPHSRGPSAALLRYQPGASIPEHQHAGYEHVFVLRGSQEDQSGHYARGTCVINPPGTRHAVTSAEGCLVLAIWNRPVVILEGETQ